MIVLIANDSEMSGWGKTEQSYRGSRAILHGPSQVPSGPTSAVEQEANGVVEISKLSISVIPECPVFAQAAKRESTGAND